LQGSAATDLRRGVKFYITRYCSSSLTATVKELLQSVYICQSYPKNITCMVFLWSTVYFPFRTTLCPEKKSLQYFGHNFIKYRQIFEILSLLQSPGNLQ